MMRARFVPILAAWIIACGPALNAHAATVIAGIVKSKAGKPLAGLALLEKGEIHNNKWDHGALVGPDGRFRIELPEGGQYGLHVYASGYIYSPNAVRVETGNTLEVSIVLVPEPTRANDPVIKRVGFFPSEARQGTVSFVKMDVEDPNGDLGPQVLAFVYQLEVATSKAPINPRDWHFVVADHKCNTTDILSFPHEPKLPMVIRQP